MNPVEAGITPTAADWPWSSHHGYLAGFDPVSNVEQGIEFFGDHQGYRQFMDQQPAKRERPPLEELACRLGGADVMSVIRGPSKKLQASQARRDFIVMALEWGYRRSELAKFLNRSPAAITMLLAYQKKLK